MAERPSRPSDTLSREEVLLACEQNYIDYWACAGAHPNAEFSESGGVTRAITGLPNEIFNVVLKCSLDPDNVEAAIDRMIEDFRRRRIPLLWHAGMLTEPRDLGRYLEERGYPHDYDLRAMARGTALDPDDVRPSDSVEVDLVSTDADSGRWIECISSSWHLPVEVSEWMSRNACFNTEVEARSGKPLPRRLYLGRISGKPVSASMLFWSRGIAGLQAVGTVPSAQGKGAGTAVIMRAVADARALGFATVVVLSTVEGERLYERAGFWRCGELPEHSMHFER